MKAIFRPRETYSANIDLVLAARYTEYRRIERNQAL